MRVRHLCILVAFLSLGWTASALYAQEDLMEEIWTVQLGKQYATEVLTAAINQELGVVVGITRGGELIAVQSDGSVTLLHQVEKRQSARLSEDGRFMGIVTHGPAFLDRLELWSVKPHESLWDRDFTEDQLHNVLIAPNRKLILGLGSRNAALAEGDELFYVFYDGAGNPIQSVPTRDLKSTYISPDGSVVLVSNRPGGDQALRYGLELYSTQGDLLWTTSMRYRMAALSAGGSVVLASQIWERSVVDVLQNGDPIGSFHLVAPARNLAVSYNGTYAIASDARTVYLLDRETGEARIIHSQDDPTWFINAMAVTDEGLIAVGLQKDSGPKFSPEERYTAGRLELVDSEGTVLFAKAFEYGRSNAWVPRIQFSEDGTLLLAQTREALTLIQRVP